MNKQISKMGWSYTASVAKMKTIIFKWKQVTVEMLAELWTARDHLSRPGARTDLAEKSARLPTWDEYCKAIGISRDTATNWLERYDPKRKCLVEPPRLLTASPPREEKGSELRRKLEEDSLTLIPPPGKGIMLLCPAKYPIDQTIVFIEPDIREEHVEDPLDRMYFISVIYIITGEDGEDLQGREVCKGTLARSIAAELWWLQADYSLARQRFEIDRSERGWFWERNGKKESMARLFVRFGRLDGVYDLYREAKPLPKTHEEKLVAAMAREEQTNEMAAKAAEASLHAAADVGAVLEAEKRKAELDECNHRLQEKGKNFLMENLTIPLEVDATLEFLDGAAAISKEWKSLFAEYCELVEFYPELESLVKTYQESEMENAAVGVKDNSLHD